VQTGGSKLLDLIRNFGEGGQSTVSGRAMGGIQSIVDALKQKGRQGLSAAAAGQAKQIAGMKKLDLPEHKWYQHLNMPLLGLLAAGGLGAGGIGAWLASRRRKKKEKKEEEED
jgi:hypothetical protein